MGRRFALFALATLSFMFVFTWADHAIHREEAVGWAVAMVGSGLFAGLVTMLVWIRETPGKYDIK